MALMAESKLHVGLNLDDLEENWLPKAFFLHTFLSVVRGIGIQSP